MEVSSAECDVISVEWENSGGDEVVFVVLRSIVNGLTTANDLVVGVFVVDVVLKGVDCCCCCWCCE